MIIKETYQDMAGNYRYLVEVDNTLAIPLKYSEEQLEAAVLSDAQRVYDQIIADEEKAELISINYDL